MNEPRKKLREAKAGLTAHGRSRGHKLSSAAMNTTSAASETSIVISDRVVHRMRSGVGASWHSIIHPTVGHGGSGFGGTPPVAPRHEKLWRSLESQAEWLGLKFLRAEMDWRQWQPERNRFTWDSPEMRILDRILGWAQRHGSDVMLQCMWHNVEWLACADYRHDPALIQVSAPADLDAFAEGWVILLDELIRKRGHSCIRWLTLVNEPNHYWWLLPPDTGASQDRARQAQYLADALCKVRAAIQAAKLPVRILGPDYTDLPVIAELSAEPWWPHVDDVDFHSYCSCFDWEEPKSLPAAGAYRLGERLWQTLLPYRAETAAAGKGLYLTEFGTQTYGYKADDPAPGGFKASLKDTELLIHALNLGIDGCNHWSFTNRGDLDGQWQLVDTWDRQWKHWLDEAAPHRDAYYVLGLAIRHLPHRAEVLNTEVKGGELQGVQRVWVVAVRSPRDDSLTVLIVNDAERPWATRIHLAGFHASVARLTSSAKILPEKILCYESVPVSNGVAALTLPPFSLTLLTDTPLAANAPGRW